MGARQGKTRQAPKIKGITLRRILNPPKVQNHPPNNSLGFQPFQVWTGTREIFLIQFVISSKTVPSSSICKQQLNRLNFPQTPPPETSK
jgi:hypothetical protein